jgi:rubrerythrin
MTVQSDLQKAIASCEAAKGSYSLMSEATEDQQAKQMFNQMSSEVDRHIQYLNDRLNYLNENNPLNS